ncbi:DUF2931 family protein [Entomomonas moraniae]|nr:DUF2931 family protein [Entomomonas moraniae]
MNIINNNKLLTIFVLLLSLFFTPLQAKEYARANYRVTLGNPYKFPMNFDLSGNYLFDNKNTVFRLFYITEGGTDKRWGESKLTELISRSDCLPTGINLRWFSAVENQFWEGRYLFDQKRLADIMAHSIDNPFENFKGSVGESPYYLLLTAYVTPNGFVNIWIHTARTKLWLGSFHAKKMTNEPDWDTFYKRALAKEYGEKVIPRHQFIAKRIATTQEYVRANYNSNEPDFFSTEQRTQPYTDKPWQEATKQYNWYLRVADNFKVKYYRSFYANTEEWFTSNTNKEPISLRPLPKAFEFILEQTKTKQKVHIELIVNYDEVQQVFEKINTLDTKNTPIELYFQLDDSVKKCTVHVVKDKQKIELKKIECYLPDEDDDEK